MIFLLIALALYPSEIAVSGLPGEEIELPAIIVSDENSRLIGEKAIEVDKKIAPGKYENIKVKIKTDLEPGVYEQFVYLTPDNKNPVITGSATKVKLTVNTKKSKKHYLLLIPIIILVACSAIGLYHSCTREVMS